MLNEVEKRILSSLILIPIAIFFIIQGSIFFIFFLIILYFVTSYEWFKMSKNFSLLQFAGIILLSFSFYSTYTIREEGFEFFLFIVTICIFTDIGGYMFGKIFKGPKLGFISPNKTYSGVVGSFIMSFISALIFVKYFEIALIFNTDNLFLFLIILFISFISQIGDLIISFFKRKAKLKDTGKILPGHGGLLDRIDGLIFVMPVIYFLLLLK